MNRVIAIVFSLAMLYLPITAHNSRISINNAQQNARSLKILMVVHTFPKLSETFIVNQIVALIERGHAVTLYSTKKKPKEEIINSDIRTFNLLESTYYKQLPPNLESYDVIIGHFGMGGKEALNTFIKKHPKMRAKLITFFYGYDISSYISSDPHYYDELFKKGDLFLVDCEYFKNRLTALGADPNKIAICHLPVQTSRFIYSAPALSSEGKINILSVTRLTEKKGLDTALHAMKKVMAKHPHVEYTIVGDGELKDTLMTLAKDLGISDRVTFAGSKSPDDVAQYLKRCHIFILPCVVAKNGNIDQMPVALKEAMACGRPVVSTYVSGIPELIENGVHGYLVQPHDSQALAEKISLLIQNPDNCRAFGIEGRKRIEKEFDFRPVSDHLENILLQITAHK